MKRVPLFTSLVALCLLVAAVPLTRAQDAASAGQSAGAAQLKKNGYTVVVEVKVNKEGIAETLRLVSSDDTSPGEFLTKMALAMAQETKFPPHLKDGKPVSFTAQVPFFFPIDDDEGAAAQNQPKPRGKAGTAVQPTYPADLLAQGVVGGAVFEMVIDTQGNIARLTTLRASHPEFEKAARDALKTWSFAPAEQDGHPVETRWRIAIVFETHSKKADIKYRIAPRPSLGTFIVVHDDSPRPEAPPAAAGAAPEQAPAAPATPAQPEAGK